MAKPGTWDTKASDWKIAYEDFDNYSVGVGYGWISFVLVSDTAQIFQPFALGGLTIGRDVGGSAVGKGRKIAEWLEKYTSPERDKLFWPLRILQPFSAFDIDGADGRASVISIGRDLILRFHAERLVTGGLLPKPLGRFFEHPANGLPVSGQIPNLGGTGMDGTWNYMGDGKCCWDKSKF